MIEMNCPTCGKILRIPIAYRGTTGRCNGCGDPVFVPHDAVSRSEALGHGSASIPPDLPEEIHVDSPRPLPRSEAIDIDMAISQREMASAQRDTAKAIRQQTTTHKIACGCLLLVLTAPVWIPILIFVFSLVVATGTTIAAALLAPKVETSAPSSPPESAAVNPGSSSAQTSTAVPGGDTTIIVQTPPPLPVTTAVYSDENYYHLEKKCAAISSDPVTSTLSLALSRGKQPCLVCAPDQPVNKVPAPTATPKPAPKASATVSGSTSVPEASGESKDEKFVSVGQVGERYHKANCSELHGIIDSMSLSKALAKGLTACPKCKPAK